MAGAKRHTIVCLSSQRWDDGMWTNKHHIMSRLSRAHDVYYVSHGARSLVKTLSQQGPRHLLEPRITRHAELSVLEFWSPPAPRLLPHGNPLRVFGEFDLRIRMLAHFFAQRGIERPIVWVYHPGYGDRPKALPHSLLVYDCVDEYTAFPEFARAKTWIAARERALCRAADVVFCTAPALYDAKRSLNPHTHLVHNVGDAEHFGRARDPELKVPDDEGRLPRPLVGFIGAVSDYKLNIEWLIALAKARPAWSIAVIGPKGLADPTTELSELEALANVHLLGHRDYAELPAYLKGFDVAVIPYRINDYTRGVFPIKFFEFLATGKPVVISNLPALAEFHDRVLVAKTADEFVARCEAALADTKDAAAARIALASRHTWDSRIAELMRHVEQRLADKY